MTEPMKYDDLDYTPSHAEVSIKHEGKEWWVPVNVECGKSMEDAGLTVFWIYGSVPEFVALLGLSKPYLAMQRLFSWPSRFFK